MVERRERQEVVEHETHNAQDSLPGQWPGLLTQLAPQERPEAALRVSVVLLTLAMPSLAGAGGEAVDSGTLSFLSRKVVEERKEEEANKVEEKRQAMRVKEADHLLQLLFILGVA